jgi:hypothetical protein
MDHLPCKSVYEGYAEDRRVSHAFLTSVNRHSARADGLRSLLTEIPDPEKESENRTFASDLAWIVLD